VRLGGVVPEPDGFFVRRLRLGPLPLSRQGKTQVAERLGAVRLEPESFLEGVLGFDPFLLSRQSEGEPKVVVRLRVIALTIALYSS
jgi:hypothetical protein